MRKSCFSLLPLIMFLAFLSGCTNKKAPAEPTFGELDPKAVASDTAMEMSMDLSYEYQNTLKESDSVVYDFLAYNKSVNPGGKELESMFHLIRRTGSTQDTIAKSGREWGGRIKSLWLCDLDHNGKSEVMFYEVPVQKSAENNFFQFYALETNGRKATDKIEIVFKQDKDHYQGRDTFFIYQNYLIRKYPYYKKQKDSAYGYILQSYKLSGRELVLANEKMEQ